MDNNLKIEKQALLVNASVGFIMGISGIVFAQLANSEALLLDGVFSLVMVFTSILAMKVSTLVFMAPNDDYQFGYSAYEALYSLLKATLLLGMTGLAFCSSVLKIIDYCHGKAIEPLKTGPVLYYTIAMILLSFGLAGFLHFYYQKTKSSILLTERTAAMIDGVISAGAGGALIGITLLKGTFLSFLVPIADAIVVIGLVLFIVKDPFLLFKSAILELAGKSLEKNVVTDMEKMAQKIVPPDAKLLTVKASRVGRTYFGIFYFKPENKIDVKMIDDLRKALTHKMKLAYPVSICEVVFTGEDNP